MLCESNIVSQMADGLTNPILELPYVLQCALSRRIINPTKEAWLVTRKNGLGGTDIAALLGLKPFGKTPLAVWVDKKNKVVEEEKFNVVFARGKYLEPLVVDLAERKYGYPIWYNDTNCSFIMTDSNGLNTPFMCTPDGLYVNSEGQLGVLECKTAAGNGSHKWYDGIPEIYKIQAIYNMYVTGASESMLAWLVDDIPGSIIYTRNEETDALMHCIMYVGNSFWNSPEMPSPETLQDYRIYYRQCCPKSILECDESLFNTLYEYVSLKEMINSYDEQTKELKNRLDDTKLLILKQIQDKEFIEYQGVTVTSYSVYNNNIRRLLVKESVINKIVESINQEKELHDGLDAAKTKRTRKKRS